MGNLLHRARVRYYNWRLRPRKCLSCRQYPAVVSKYDYKVTMPTFCTVECRDDWHETMQTI